MLFKTSAFGVELMTVSLYSSFSALCIIGDHTFSMYANFSETIIYYRVVSRTNYFRKTGGHPKSEAPK